MKKRIAGCLLLGLLALFPMMLSAIRVEANEDGSENGMVLAKTAKANADGSYTISLEAYTTGEKVISTITKDVPTDIVLVLDQSGSMEEDIGSSSYTLYQDETGWWGNITYHTRNRDYYECRHNGGSANLWHRLDDGSFASVSVTRHQGIVYSAVTNGRNESSGRWDQYTSLYENRNNLYVRIDGEYIAVRVERSGRYYSYTYVYSLPDGTQIAVSDGATSAPAISGTDDNLLYLASADDAQTVYTYSYTDAEENTQVIVTSVGAETTVTPGFYEKVTTSSGGGSRLQALQTAVSNFAGAVTAKAAGEDGEYGTGDDTNHRIAVVGFATGKETISGYPAYENTEVFIGDRQYNYQHDAANVYGIAFQDMDTQQGYENVIASKNALAARGATLTNLGIAMANGIFAANPVPDGQQRNRVVIVFTDGIPGLSGYDGSVAGSAIAQADIAKNTYGATVYTVGVFPGADATSAGSTGMGSSNADKGNYFLQRVSSNTQYPQNPGYYLSAGDADSLNTIFQQIAGQIETGGAAATLDARAVIKDIIAPAFTLPAGTTSGDIRLETYACTGKDGNGYVWQKNPDAMGARALIGSTDGSRAVTTENQIVVTGFDFAENYVGTVNRNGEITWRGNKLVITFDIWPRDGFLGGNDVFTNSSAGIYTDENAEEAVMVFERPQVDVDIAEPSISVPDANVYLGADLAEIVNAEEFRREILIRYGDTVELDLSQADDNWGLEEWQTEYVTLEVSIRDKNGGEITDAQKLKEDTGYQVQVSIRPKTPKEGNSGFENNAPGKIRVFTPELTFMDSIAFYGEEVPVNNDFSANYDAASRKWKNKNTYATDEGVKMLGTEPSLEMTYTPEESRLENRKYTKEDLPVAVTVRIGNEDVTGYTTFLHQDCSWDCGFQTSETPGKPAFLIHIRTCTLSVSKQGGAADASYVFAVYKDGVKYSEVAIWGNGTKTLVSLPVGTYTVQEDTGWSWRWTADNGGSAKLTAQSPEGGIICTNTKKNSLWLNGFSRIVRNILESVTR